MTDYRLISERIMMITLTLEDKPLTLLQIYALDTSYSDVDINIFYESIKIEFT